MGVGPTCTKNKIFNIYLYWWNIAKNLKINCTMQIDRDIMIIWTDAYWFFFLKENESIEYLLLKHKN